MQISELMIVAAKTTARKYSPAHLMITKRGLFSAAVIFVRSITDNLLTGRCITYNLF